jgi:6,7-dimethyl-8-ribityllumazine synthase
MMREDGEPATGDDAISFSQKHGLILLTVERLAQYRRNKETGGAACLAPVNETKSKMWVDDIQAECSMHVFSTSDPKIEIVAVVKGDVTNQEGVPTRIHSECFTGDVLASQRCDCGQQLHRFMRIMNEESCGVLLYIRGQEGRGIGLISKIRAYKLQDEGHDTVDANLKLGLPVDTRTYDDALCVLQQLKLKSVSLYTNNPEKMRALAPITKGVVALASIPGERNMGYLKTKRERLNHRTVLDTFKLPDPPMDTSKLKVGIVYTTWNQYYVDELRSKAENELQSSSASTVKMAVPGACELISGARAMLRQNKPDAVIAIGVLIRGSSDLYDATCNAVMTGLTELNASQDTPIVLGLLMCHDDEQAHQRSHGEQNPAKAWAETALHMAGLTRKSALDSMPGTPAPQTSYR